jgi:hypothetical protein
MDFRVSEKVAAKIGTPTLETLPSRITEAAPCLECGNRLGTDPVSVIGQQHGKVAVIIGAHASCRSSEWFDAEASGQIQIPISPPVTMVIELPNPSGPAWWNWIATAAGMRPKVPYLIVFPHPGITWVRLAGLGESVNDDLRFYRETYGMSSDLGTDVPQIEDAQAWINNRTVTAPLPLREPWPDRGPRHDRMRS